MLHDCLQMYQPSPCRMHALTSGRVSDLQADPSHLLERGGALAYRPSLALRDEPVRKSDLPLFPDIPIWTILPVCVDPLGINISRRILHFFVSLYHPNIITNFTKS